jgi:phospholipid transport system transporter-binding protein
LATGKKPAKARARAAGSKRVGAARQPAASRSAPAQAAADVELVPVLQPAPDALALPEPTEGPVEPQVPAMPAHLVESTVSASPDPAPDAVIHLGAHLTIREAVALRAELLERVDLVDAVGLDASGVQKVDTAGLQVLLAFTRQRRRADVATVWTGCSDSVRRGAASLDLVQALGLPAGGAS